MPPPSMRIVPSWREPRTRSLSRLRAQRKVDLPLRAGPMMPRISFRRTSRSRALSLRTSPKYWLKPSTRMAMSLISAAFLSLGIFLDKPVHQVISQDVYAQDGDDQNGGRAVGLRHGDALPGQYVEVDGHRPGRGENRGRKPEGAAGGKDGRGRLADAAADGQGK